MTTARHGDASYAVVLANGLNGYGALRSLAAAGIESIVIAPSEKDLSASDVQRGMPGPTGSSSSGGECVGILLALLATGSRCHAPTQPCQPQLRASHRELAEVACLAEPDCGLTGCAGAYREPWIVDFFTRRHQAMSNPKIFAHKIKRIKAYRNVGTGIC
jgi:hypothetical protein